jgi:hypothetical protein
MSFSKLKKSREKMFDHISSKFQEATNAQTYSTEDERLWYPQGDKAGNGSAVIRFLPPTETAPNGLPWVKVFKHSFQGPTGSWLIENCPTTLGKECPICEANREYWNSGIESDKKIASTRKRKVSYLSNVYVIKDPGNPENEGQVKIYRYGKIVYDMLNELMNPSFDDVEKVNPFDLWEGASFRLRFKMEDGYRKYSASTFDNPKPLFDDDAKLEEVYNQMYDLNEFVDPSIFKPYDDLKKRLELVTVGAKKRPPQVEEEVEDAVASLDNDLSEAEEIKVDSETDEDLEEFNKIFDELNIDDEKPF